MKNIYFVIIILLLSFGFALGQEQVVYSITFTSTWSQNSHPHPSGNLPDDAHWSKLVGAVHTNDIIFFEMGELSTPGVEDIAERGNNDIFFDEVETAISQGDALSIIDGGALDTPGGTVAIENVVLSQDFPIVSILSMIAPSPDWMIGINNLSLLDGNGNWIDELELNVYPYDAGTDSGTDYDSADNDTNPASPMSSLQGVAPFSEEIMGTISFRLEGVLGAETIGSNNAFSLYPNPSEKTLHISSANSPIKNISIYNSLGMQVMSFQNMDVTDVELNIENLSNGMYLVQITDTENTEQIKKLVKF